LIILAAIYVIIHGSAHNVPKVGLAYDPRDHSLHIVHMGPDPESQPEMTANLGSGVGSDVSPLWPYHLALISSGFILVLSGALTARFMKKRKGWLTIHRSLGIAGIALVLVGLIVVVMAILVLPDLPHIGAPRLPRPDHSHYGCLYALPGIPPAKKMGQKSSCPAQMVRKSRPDPHDGQRLGLDMLLS